MIPPSQVLTAETGLTIKTVLWIPTAHHDELSLNRRKENIWHNNVAL